MSLLPPPTPPAPPRLALSVQEAATALGVSVSTIRRLIRIGKFRTGPGLRHRVISVASIHKWMGDTP